MPYTAARRQMFYCLRKRPALNVTARKAAWRPTAPSATAITRGGRKPLVPYNSRWRAPPTALFQTLPLQHVRRLGLRPSSVAGLADPTPLAVLLRSVDRQSAAATALWMVPGRLWKHYGCNNTFYAGGLLNTELENRSNSQARFSRIERAIKEPAKSGQPKHRKRPTEAIGRGQPRRHLCSSRTRRSLAARR